MCVKEGHNYGFLPDDDGKREGGEIKTAFSTCLGGEGGAGLRVP